VLVLRVRYSCGQRVALYHTGSQLDNALHAENARSRGLVKPSIIGHISRCGQEIANQEPGRPSSLQAACCNLHGPARPEWGHQTVHTRLIRVVLLAKD
jgi:hypothetical protein